MLILTLLLAAADPSIEERLAKLEAQVRQLQIENQQLREKLGVQAATPAPPQAPVAATALGPERQLQIGGLLQAQYETGGRTDARYTDDNDRVFLRRARVNASGRFAEHFDFKTEIEMTGSLAPASGLRGQLTDAYVTWIPNALLNIRAGQFKTPFGFEQLYPDPRLYAPERTVGSDRLTLSRQIGVAALGAWSRFNYCIGAFNGNGTNTSGNDDDRFLYVGRVSAKVARFGFGVNAFNSRDASVAMAAELGFKSNTFSGERSGIGADAQFASGPVEVWAEWLRDHFSPASRVPFRSFHADAKSILGVYTLKKLQFVARYDTYDPDARIAGLETKTWEGGANYLIHGHDLKLQLHLVRGKTGDVAHDRVIARLQTVF